MKAVMLSIQPKWCELIANGKKTIEVRKTAPKLEAPFKCYIYCTKPPRSELFHHGCIYEYAHELIRLQDGRIVYDYGMRLACEDGEYSRDNFLCQKVIGEFMCDSVDTIAVYNEQIYAVEHFQNDILQQSHLTLEEIKAYLGAKNRGYAWYISDLKIYNKPKELGEFKRECKQYGADNPLCDDCRYYDCCKGLDFDESDCVTNGYIPLTRPPQSWCYVNEASE